MTAAPALAPAAPVVRLLGPLEVAMGVAPKTRKVRVVLALLAVRAGAAVELEAIARELWPFERPPSWRATVQTYVLRIRQAMGPAAVRTVGGSGYALAARPEDVDVVRFVRYVDAAVREHGAGLRGDARDHLLAALSMWRGEPFGDVACGPVLSEWARMVRDRAASARRLGFEAALDAGQHRVVLDELRAEWRADPVSESMAALLMTALYRSQSRGEALEVFARTRAALQDELGLDPGPALARLQQKVLAGDPSLELGGDTP